MRAQSHSSRSRYKTPLPFATEVAHYEWTRDQSMNRYDNDVPKVDSTRIDHPPLVTMRSYGTTSSADSTQSRQAAIMADSCLPYQRLARTDLRKMAAELDLIDNSSTSSEERNLTHGTILSTETSRLSNDKLSSRGNSTDETTPEESPEQKQAILQTLPLSTTPASKSRRHSISSIHQNRQMRSPIRIIDDSPPRLRGQFPQGKDQAQLASIPSKRQDYQFPIVTNSSPPSVPPRRSSRERVITTRGQHTNPEIPPYSPYRESPTEQTQFPERGRSLNEHALIQKPTTIRKQRNIENSSRAKFPYQNEHQVPSERKTPRQINNREISNVSIPSRAIIGDTVDQIPKSETSRFRVSPPPLQRIPSHEAFRSAHEPERRTRRSQSVATARPPFSQSSSPTAQKFDDPTAKDTSFPAPWQQSSQSNHARISSKRQPRSTSAWRPPSVWYENVDGVDLSTRPKSAKESRGGLSIPEIEARDIRDIPLFRGRSRRDSELDYKCRFADRDEDYASPPPAIGGDISAVRSISPRPGRDSRDHVLFDNYSRAAADEMPDQRANPPRARRSESFSRMNLSVPEVIREMPIAESESADDADIESTDSEAAMPPDVARLRSFEEQDAQMTSRTDQVKNLLGGMIKGLSGKMKKDDYKHNKTITGPDYKSTSEDPTRPDRATEFYLDDSDDVESVNSRPNTVIWSPPKGTGRISEDTFYSKRMSLMSDGSRNTLSGEIPAQSAFVSRW